MGLTAWVSITIGHVEGDFVHIELSTPLSSDVERPKTGALDTTLRCPSCRRQFAVQVCSLVEASRRRRVLLGLASLALAGAAGVGLFIWHVAIGFDTAIPAILTAIVGGLLLAATPVLIANAAFYDGVHGPWQPGKGVRHWLRRGVRGHRLATQKIF